MPGVAWSGGGNFSNALNGRTTVATIPPGSYGTNPVILVAIAYHGGDPAQGPYANHTIDLLLPGGGTIPLDYPAAFHATSAFGADESRISADTLATGALDGGADIRVKTNFATPSPPEVGVAAACVLTFAVARIRDYLLLSMTPFGGVIGGGMFPGTISGAFSSGVWSFPALYAPEPYAIGALAFAGVYSAGAPSWASLPAWTDVITRTNGSNVVQLALWTQPTPMDANYQITNSPGANNGTYEVLTIVTRLPAGPTPVFGGQSQIVG